MINKVNILLVAKALRKSMEKIQQKAV